MERDRDQEIASYGASIDLPCNRLYASEFYTHSWAHSDSSIAPKRTIKDALRDRAPGNVLRGTP